MNQTELAQFERFNNVLIAKTHKFMSTNLNEDFKFSQRDRCLLCQSCWLN